MTSRALEWLTFNDIKRYAIQHFRPAFESLPPQFTIKIERLTEEQMRIPVRGSLDTSSVLKFRVLVGHIELPSFQNIYLYFIEDDRRMLLGKLCVERKAISKLHLTLATWESPFRHLVTSDIIECGRHARTVALYYLVENAHIPRLRDSGHFLYEFRTACETFYKAQLETEPGTDAPSEPAPQTPKTQQSQGKDGNTSASRGSNPSMRRFASQPSSQSERQSARQAGEPAHSTTLFTASPLGMNKTSPRPPVQKKRKRDSIDVNQSPSTIQNPTAVVSDAIRTPNRLSHNETRKPAPEESAETCGSDIEDQIDQHMASLKTLRTAQKTKITTLQFLLTQTQSDLATTTHLVTTLQSKLDAEKADAAFLRADQELLTKELHVWKDRTTDLNKQASTLEHAKVSLTGRVKGLESEKRELEEGNKSLTNEARDLKAKDEESKREIEELKKRISVLTRSKEQWEEEKEGLEKKLDVARQMAKMTTQMQVLGQQI